MRSLSLVQFSVFHIKTFSWFCITIHQTKKRLKKLVRVFKRLRKTSQSLGFVKTFLHDQVAERNSRKQWFCWLSFDLSTWPVMHYNPLLRATVSVLLRNRDKNRISSWIHSSTQLSDVAVRSVQLEDLLMALAERRIFPETLFLEARGMVGDTWSPESVTVTLRSALVL